ncbi:MAG TPA: glycosyltransferase family 2 protein [Rhodanobacteraceae bacterium]|nr:glycosyltransferase family 2 protein [Rhodanobacteraceae bacterium]
MTDAVTTGVVTALVVAADSGPLLQDCVRDLLACPQIAAVRLADNASRDGVPQRVQADCAAESRFALVNNQRNLGFGAAVNRLAAGATTPWLAIVNPDCRLQPAALDALLAIGTGQPDVGLIGALIVDEAGRIEPASRRRDPLLSRLLVTLGLRRGDAINMDAPESADAACGETVEAVSGALMLVRRDVFEQLGGFDEGYFLHFEDLDLCRRTRDAGHRVVLASQIRVVHVKGSSSRHRPVFVAWHKHRGLWRWLRTFDPALRNPLLAAVVWCGIWVHFLVLLPRHLLQRAAALTRPRRQPRA